MAETIVDLLAQKAKGGIADDFERELAYLGNLERDIPNLLGRLDALIARGKELGLDVAIMVTVREAVQVGMDSAMKVIGPALGVLSRETR